jgi:hypothetical protein
LSSLGEDRQQSSVTIASLRLRRPCQAQDANQSRGYPCPIMRLKKSAHFSRLSRRREIALIDVKPTIACKQSG